MEASFLSQNFSQTPVGVYKKSRWHPTANDQHPMPTINDTSLNKSKMKRRTNHFCFKRGCKLMILTCSESHVLTIWCRVNTSNYTCRANTSVALPKFPIFPQYVLSVCSFSETVHFIVWFISPNVATGPYGKSKNFPIQTYIAEEFIGSDTCALSATFVFIRCLHRPTDTTDTPIGILIY